MSLDLDTRLANGAAWAALGKVSSTLRSDVMHANRDLASALQNYLTKGKEGTLNSVIEQHLNYSMRGYVRAAFAHIEGTLYTLKQVALALNRCIPTFSEAELFVPREVVPEVSDNGMPRERGKYIMNPIVNMKLTFKMVQKVYKLEHETAFSGSGWDAFREATQIRHTVTHPKSLETLIIWEPSKDDSVDRLQPVTEGWFWYDATYQQLLSDMTDALPRLFSEERVQAIRTPSEEHEDTELFNRDPILWFENYEQRNATNARLLRENSALRPADATPDSSEGDE